MTRVDGEEFESTDPGDRVLDALLQEAVQGTHVPDLAARVTARLQGSGGVRTGPAARGPGIVRLPRRRVRWVSMLVGTIAGAAATAFFVTRLQHEHSAARAVSWQVVGGCLQWQGRSAGATARAGEQAMWPLDTGDRLRTCEENVAVCDVASLGRLYMSKATEVEIAAMEWKSFGGGTALGAVTVAVIAGAITWSGGGDVARAQVGESLELRAQSPQLAAATVEDLSRRVEELQGELAAQRARAQELEVRASRTTAANAAQAAAADAGIAAAPSPLKHAVTYAGMESALAAIDWDVTGKCMHEMTRKLDEFYAAMEKGEEMPLELLGEVAKLNAELIKQAAGLMKAKVPGTGPNGVFTNPVVAANQVHATLTKAGLPLSNEQQDALQRLSAQIAGEDEVRRGKISDEDFELAEVLGETELKDRFYGEARRLLTPQQEAALFPSRLAGTAGNLFDTGLVWAQFAKPVAVTDRGDLADKMTQALARQAGLGDDLTPQVRAAVDAWAKALPDDAFHPEADDMSKVGLGKVSGVRAAAARQLALLRQVSATVALTPAQKAKLRKVGPVFVPHRAKR